MYDTTAAMLPQNATYQESSANPEPAGHTFNAITDPRFDPQSIEFQPERLGIDLTGKPDLLLGRDVRRKVKGIQDLASERGRSITARRAPYFVLEQLCDLSPAPVEWLWPGCVPLRQLTLLAGDPRVGKSLVAIDLAARVSRGAGWPGSPEAKAPPGRVLILSLTSASQNSIIPSLVRAGANLENVFFANGVYRPMCKEPEEAIQRPISLDDDMRTLIHTIRELSSVRLVVLDPLWAFIDKTGSPYVGERAARLAALAASWNLAIVGVADLKRDNRGRRLLRVAGDVALPESAQMVWGLVNSPADDGRRVMLPLKADLAPATPARELRIDDGAIVWESQPSEWTVDTLLAAERGGCELDDVRDWLRTLLLDGAQPSLAIFAAAKECGISMATLRRAKAVLGARVKFHREDGSGWWVWTFNEQGLAGGLDESPLDVGERCSGIDSETAHPSRNNEHLLKNPRKVRDLDLGAACTCRPATVNRLGQ